MTLILWLIQSQILQTDCYFVLSFSLSHSCHKWMVSKVYIVNVEPILDNDKTSRTDWLFFFGLHLMWVCQITHSTSFTFRCAHLIGICIHWNTLLIHRTKNAFMVKYNSWSFFIRVFDRFISFPSHSDQCVCVSICFGSKWQRSKMWIN